MGLICNRMLGMGIWDYSDRWGNLWGQICPRFSFYWFLLCIPVFVCFACADRLNRMLGMGIWDYSDRWGNLWGQICPRFSFYWFLLCIPVFVCFACADRLRAALRPA